MSFKEIPSKVPGLSFRITGVMKTTKNIVVIHDESQLPVVSFVGVKNPTTLVRIANEVLYHPTFWTTPADLTDADRATLGEFVLRLTSRIQTDRYGHKRVS